MTSKQAAWRTLPILLLAISASCVTTPGRSSDERAVLDTVQDFFDAMAAGDVQAAEATAFSESTFISVRRENGALSYRSFSHAQFLETLETSESELLETFIGIPTVLIEGDVAMVWGSYTFEKDGQHSHTGVDAFALLRTDEGWKLAGGAYSVVPPQ